MSKKPPADLVLGGRGRSLWRAVLAEFDPDQSELLILHEAARCLDRIDALAAEVERTGLMTTGSTGQRVCNPAVAEARLQQQQLGRLLGQLGIDRTEAGADGRGVVSLASARGRRAATARWSQRGARNA
jgi:hypothetical protein